LIGIYILISVVAFVLGAVALILATGYRRHEPTTREERSAETKPSEDDDAREANQTSDGSGRRREGVGDTSLAEIESFLRKERALVEKFLLQPSRETLFAGNDCGSRHSRCR